MSKTSFKFYGKQAIIFSNGEPPNSSEDIMRSQIFKHVIHKFLEKLRSKDSPLLEIFPDSIKNDEAEKAIIELLQMLSKHKKEDVIKDFPKYEPFFKDTYKLNQFVETLYDYWRSFERFFVCYTDKNLTAPHHQKPYSSFNNTVQNLNSLVRKVYRDICENITGDYPKVFRQLPACAQIGLVVVDEKMDLPSPYDKLRDVPFIRQVLIEPPLIIDPPMNKRDGQFRRLESQPLEELSMNRNEWLCYPAKVGELLINVYFHNKFIGLGTALANLFDLADDGQIKKKPDAIYVYGFPEQSARKFGELPTVFYEDEKNNLVIGAVPDSDAFGYFGYLKKMVLTLHNIIMIKRGIMPLHGAMVKIGLKNKKYVNIIIIGDTGAGKSESLEAFRILGDKYIRDMSIIFDDMGSLNFKNGTVKAYGTETGAFVRLDDLQPGFAFGTIDRSIIMSPHKKNARVVLPVTTMQEVLCGYKVDYLLYANNYEAVDAKHPILEVFDSADAALDVFRKGRSMSKGTTTSTGMTECYFANIFGPAQYQDAHEPLAKKYFHELKNSGCVIGQLRTMLAIPGYESKGPEAAAKAILDSITK